MLLDKEDIPKDELKSYLSIISNLRANVDVNEDLYPYKKYPQVLHKQNKNQPIKLNLPNKRILPKKYRLPTKVFEKISDDKFQINYEIGGKSYKELINTNNTAFYDTQDRLFIPIPVPQGSNLFESINDCRNTKAKQMPTIPLKIVSKNGDNVN